MQSYSHSKPRSKTASLSRSSEQSGQTQDILWSEDWTIKYQSYFDRHSLSQMRHQHKLVWTEPWQVQALKLFHTVWTPRRSMGTARDHVADHSCPVGHTAIRGERTEKKKHQPQSQGIAQAAKVPALGDARTQRWQAQDP